MAAPEERRSASNSRLRPMLNERIAFVGSFISPSKDEMESYVTDHGGKAQNFVSEHTTMVVVGSYHTTPAKLLRADELNQQGAAIRIISEDEFLKESADLTEPIVSEDAGIGASSKSVSAEPEAAEGEPVFSTRRARRDHERMTEALAILQIDENTGRAYHEDTIADITVTPKDEPAAEAARPTPVETKTERVSIEMTRQSVRRVSPKTANKGVVAALTEAEENAGLKLWMIPVACFVALTVSVMTESEVMTFVSVAATLSSMTLITLFNFAQRSVSTS